ncbi:hypothetical protein OB69_04030 [Roseivirga seohaensis subsp. aquiponti]|uniref:HTH cro/C1-type domain-containing protein n=1 Tax=Roseivirga seohaensis subsp. aquiponti TaxID=1566026 RepID=A0A0L8APQ4_9BACT|nr:XRE family transcriptional regulator [Roseivirga seohaensis]KOF04157.1 hypothetical protein OB69_04030 [Roseivirga seohaensis subsp. aquiponti]
MNPYTLDEAAEKVGAKIKQLRIDGGYTSYENFAVANSLDRKQYWRVEKGANIRLNTLLDILNIHKITLEEFFKGL